MKQCPERHTAFVAIECRPFLVTHVFIELVRCGRPVDEDIKKILRGKQGEVDYEEVDDYSHAETNRLKDHVRRMLERNVAKEAFLDYKTRRSEYSKRQTVSRRLSTNKGSN